MGRVRRHINMSKKKVYTMNIKDCYTGKTEKINQDDFWSTGQSTNQRHEQAVAAWAVLPKIAEAVGLNRSELQKETEEHTQAEFVFEAVKKLVEEKQRLEEAAKKAAEDTKEDNAEDTKKAAEDTKKDNAEDNGDDGTDIGVSCKKENLY